MHRQQTNCAILIASSPTGRRPMPAWANSKAPTAMRRLRSGTTRKRCRLSHCRHLRAATLADLYRALGDEGQAETVLLQGLELAPENAALLHALGLLSARTGRPDEALQQLQRAAELGRNPRYDYVYGIALNSTGAQEHAVEVLAGRTSDLPDRFRYRLGPLRPSSETGVISRARTSLRKCWPVVIPTTQPSRDSAMQCSRLVNPGDAVVKQLAAHDKQQHVNDPKEESVRDSLVEPDSGQNTDRRQRGKHDRGHEVATRQLAKPGVRHELLRS